MRRSLCSYQSQESLQEALGAARLRRMKSYELRAAMNLARLWGERGRRAEAHELLALVYGLPRDSKPLISRRPQRYSTH
jgi:predicted ATPase